jgi:hypothetical protein
MESNKIPLPNKIYCGALYVDTQVLQFIDR